MEFYGYELGLPLSAWNNTRDWDRSQLNWLYQQSNKGIHLRELEGRARDAEYAWRVVDAQISGEDDVMSYFFAHDEDGVGLWHATFGIANKPGDHKIRGGFAYPPQAGNAYYVPPKPEIHTGEGGIAVCVLDYAYPSEELTLALIKDGPAHYGLHVTFQLLKTGSRYPNDYPIR